MTMATKEQERAALQHIRKIVDSLGDYSYVKTAFTGCFELAEENIENDFGNSAKFFIDEYYNRSRENEKLSEAKQKYAELSQKYDALDSLYKISVKSSEEAERRAANDEERIRGFEVVLEAKETEIMRLKAKLYDLMVKD